MLKIEEIKSLIDEDKSSPKKQKAQEGLHYYEGHHDIEQYKVYYFNDDGNLQEDDTKSNIRISHPFFTEQIDQKAQYFLSGKEKFVKSKLPELQTALDEYFDDEFKAELSDAITYSGAEGHSFLYGYKGEDGRTHFSFAEGLCVVEVSAKYASDSKDHIIYYYVDKIEKDKVITAVQDWDNEQTYYYKMDDSTITLDEDVEINPRPHILFEEEKDGSRAYDNYGLIPFWRLDNNRKQTSDLAPIKALIDDYDLHACGMSNNLQDLADGYFVVKGFGGENLSELIHNIKVKKAVGVAENGNVEIKTVNIPYEAREAKLKLDETNIYRFGMAFNSAQVGDGNITNIVIKSRYALLDMKCNKLEKQVKKTLRQLLNVVLDEINSEKGTQYASKDVEIAFDRETPTNESDNAQIKLTNAQRQQVEINNLLSAAEKLDDETIIKGLCNILDIDYEEIKGKINIENNGLGLNAASELLLKKQEE